MDRWAHQSLGNQWGGRRAAATADTAAAAASRHRDPVHGEQGQVDYYAKNRSITAITRGTATFNVTPLQAGRYFSKIQCFCFEDQQLEPGQEVDMPVIFYVDPAIRDDPDLKDLRQITLAYTFFNAAD